MESATKIHAFTADRRSAPLIVLFKATSHVPGQHREGSLTSFFTGEQGLSLALIRESGGAAW